MCKLNFTNTNLTIKTNHCKNINLNFGMLPDSLTDS